MSRQWLGRVGADADVADVVAQDVSERLAALPSLLHGGAAVADRMLAVLPDGVAQRLLGLPVIGEYGRLVESLTAVAYFDVVSRQVPIPGPRPAPEPALEPLA